MYGFLITRGIPEQETVLENPQTIVWGETRFYYHPLPKFEKDHLFYEDDEKVVLLDGVILNNHELMEERNNQNWREVVDQLILENPATFQKNLRGSFCGAVLNKCSGELLVFTNQTGEKTVYYTQQESIFIAASHNNILTQVMKMNRLSVYPNIQGLRELLCCRRLLRNNTPFQNVYRLTGGKYLAIDGVYCSEERYHMFRNVPEVTFSIEECIDRMDVLFRQAVDRIFAKNTEYGYQGACDLSGGLDGRMVTWIAHDLGYRNILNVCYSQSGTIDHHVSKKIAKDLSNDYYFLPMNGGDFLMDIDEMIDKFGGQVAYEVCTGANRAYNKEISKRKIALCATGLIAGEYQGAFIEGPCHTLPNSIESYSTVIPFITPELYKEEYENNEQMALYERDLPLIMNSVLIRQQFFEAVSPYGDVDFLEFAYRIPMQWRKNRGICMKWIVEKYPEASKYIYQHARMPLYNFYYHRKYFPKVISDGKRLFFRCINKVSRIYNWNIQLVLNDEMNPIDQWYRTNVRLRQFFDQYYQENITKIKDPQLQEDVRRTFLEGTPFDKVQALNVLGVYKRYF